MEDSKDIRDIRNAEYIRNTLIHLPIATILLCHDKEDLSQIIQLVPDVHDKIFMNDLVPKGQIYFMHEVDFLSWKHKDLFIGETKCT
jgi:hypothetical protein